MSALTSARRFNPRGLTGLALAALAILAAIVLLASDPRVFVALTSDRDGQALLPVSTLAPGSTTTGDLTLANEGLLPLRYDLRVEAGQAELNSGVIIRVRRDGALNYAYQGPLSDRPIPLGTLLPGERDQVQVTLSAPPSQATASIPVDDTFVWTARSPGFDSWWWLLLVAAGLVVAAFGLPRLLALWTWLRTRRRVPFELFWRVPLILAVLLVATLVPLSSVSLASVNAQSANPANVFAVGALVLSDQQPAKTSCLSISSLSSQTALPGRCDAIFAFGQGVPGMSGTAKVTIRNLGTAPITTFGVYSNGCASTPAEAIHGGGDGCAGVDMTIHDDSHGACVFPVAQAGDCPPGAGTMRSFARDHGPSRPLALSPQGLGAGVTFTFAVTVDPSDDNSYQGLSPQMDFNWQVAQ